jgi:hypothetical protein
MSKLRKLLGGLVGRSQATRSGAGASSGSARAGTGPAQIDLRKSVEPRPEEARAVPPAPAAPFLFAPMSPREPAAPTEPPLVAEPSIPSEPASLRRDLDF